MIKGFVTIIVFSLISICSTGQSIDSLQLSDNEIPAGYTKSPNLLCVTPHASSFYDQTDMYASFLGKVKKKSFQSFDKKGDQGSILYFEYEEEFKGGSFLKGLLWGSGSKASKSEPDEYYSKGKILVIWSFNLKSDIKTVSKEKVMSALGK